jgi:SNF2 family DNA or RNA helicase
MALQLYAHQKESVAFASKLKAFFDASDPGTGKTAVQIELFRRRRKGRKGGKCALVIAPKSLLRPAWFMDFQKFAPELKCSIAYADNREEAFATEADVYITNTYTFTLAEAVAAIERRIAQDAMNAGAASKVAP